MTNTGGENGWPPVRLIEILIVIAILAALTALLLPVFAHTRTSALKSVCLSNQRQIGTAFALYAQDYDERLRDFHSDPICAAHAEDTAYWHDRFCRSLSLEPSQRSFAALLQPFLRSEAVAFCPADHDRQAGGREMTSYEYKLWLARGRALAEVPAPSGLALLWEQWGYHEGDGYASEYQRRTAMNVLFLDDHVRWKHLADTTTARYGSGPNLHGLFKESEPADPLHALDFVP